MKRTQLSHEEKNYKTNPVLRNEPNPAEFEFGRREFLLAIDAAVATMGLVP